MKTQADQMNLERRIERLEKKVGQNPDAPCDCDIDVDFTTLNAHEGMRVYLQMVRCRGPHTWLRRTPLDPAVAKRFDEFYKSGRD